MLETPRPPQCTWSWVLFQTRQKSVAQRAVSAMAMLLWSVLQLSCRRGTVAACFRPVATMSRRVSRRLVHLSLAGAAPTVSRLAEKEEGGEEGEEGEQGKGVFQGFSEGVLKVYYLGYRPGGGGGGGGCSWCACSCCLNEVLPGASRPCSAARSCG